MKKTLLLAISIILLFGFGYSIDDARLLRMPDINTDLIVFVYAGDIWSVPADGGEARRLTSHEGLEIFPKISPDGNWIAFSAEYSGSRQIYVMPAKGGTPKQLTYYNDVGAMPPRGGWDNIPLDWTPDSKKILFRSNRTPHGKRAGKYFVIPLTGGLETPLIIPEGGFGTFSPDANTLVYTPVSREFRTWKRSKSGRASDVWTYDLKNNTSRRLTIFPGTDQFPSQYKDKIYFVSDRDLTLNYYSCDKEGKNITQITHHKEFDVMWPAGHNGLIAYENGGFIYKLNLDSGKTEKVSVNMNYDNPNLLPYHKNVKSFLSIFGTTISPEGKRVAFDARGDIFSVPAKKGLTVNLTRTQGVREMYPAWSPDGKWIAYISDKSGDFELYLMDPKGKKAPIQLTQNDSVWKSRVLWSPDSKKVLFTDTTRKLRMLDIGTKKITTIDNGCYTPINFFNWSGDSNWIVYAMSNANNLNAIWLYSLEQNKKTTVSKGNYEDFAPCFSECGKYLFFLSDRDFEMDFRHGFASMEFDYVMTRTA
ncbi:MAG: acetyl-CoA synthetase, partial [bacterium]|nr:acetyl-CoA synthetase [bacterium]